VSEGGTSARPRDDVERGYAVFGSTGALVFTAVLLLPGLLSVVGLDGGLLFAVTGGNVLLIWMLALALVLFRSPRPREA
jgi:hypothetical protein